MDINGVLFRLMDIKMNIEVLDLLKMSYFPNIHYLGNLSFFFGGSWFTNRSGTNWKLQGLEPLNLDPPSLILRVIALLNMAL